MVSFAIKSLGLVSIIVAFVANPMVVGLASPDGKISSPLVIGSIVCFESALFIVGTVLLWKADSVAVFFGKRRKELLLAVAVFVVSWIGLDVLLGRFTPGVYEPTKYGWSPQPHLVRTRSVNDTTGHHRNVVNEYFAHGFKRWGESGSDRPRVLVIGDSFTEMSYVSNGEEWYAVLETRFPSLELFVFGAGGYGSLQEFMVLDDFVDEIRPHAILWQFSNNDYWNNLYEWDRAIYPFNNFGTRPYLENDEVTFRMPLAQADLRTFSKTVDYTLALYDVYAKSGTVGRTPAIKVQENVEARAYDVTVEILSRARQRAGSIPFVLFSAGPFGKRERMLCDAVDLICIPGVYSHIAALQREGAELRVVDDGHWNLEGNRVVGEYLVTQLSQLAEFTNAIGG